MLLRIFNKIQVNLSKSANPWSDDVMHTSSSGGNFEQFLWHFHISSTKARVLFFNKIYFRWSSSCVSRFLYLHLKIFHDISENGLVCKYKSLWCPLLSTNEFFSVVFGQSVYERRSLCVWFYTNLQILTVSMKPAFRRFKKHSDVSFKKNHHTTIDPYFQHLSNFIILEVSLINFFILAFLSCCHTNKQ